jgi:hypothetical protein
LRRAAQQKQCCTSAFDNFIKWLGANQSKSCLFCLDRENKCKISVDSRPLFSTRRQLLQELFESGIGGIKMHKKLFKEGSLLLALMASAGLANAAMSSWEGRYIGLDVGGAINGNTKLNFPSDAGASNQFSPQATGEALSIRSMAPALAFILARITSLATL